MRVDIIETPDLGDRSYVVSDCSTALVVDRAGHEVVAHRRRLRERPEVRPADHVGMTVPAAPSVTCPAATGPVVALDLDDDLPRRAAAGVPDAEGPSGAGRLPLVPLAGVAAGGAFAFWTSLTCFVC